MAFRLIEAFKEKLAYVASLLITFLILLPVTLAKYVSGGRRPDGPGVIGELLEAEYAICSSVAV